MPLAQGNEHPFDNTKLPSFMHPELLDVAEEITRASQCWGLLRKSKEHHLPQELGEPKKAYEARLIRSSYSSFFRDAIVAYAGSLSRFDTNLLPPSMAAVINNIDNQGTSLVAQLAYADSLMLRDGGCLLMVDTPPSGQNEARTLGQQKEAGRRPYLTVHCRMATRNWKAPIKAGLQQVRRVTIAEVRESPDQEDDFGTTYETVYRVIEGGSWVLLRIKKDEKAVSGYTTEAIDEGIFEGPDGEPLSEPPVYWYSALGKAFGSGDLPLLSLADLTLDHFREYSDLKELLHSTALITPVRKGALGTGPVGPDGVPTTPPLCIGPHSGQDLPADGDFTFAEVEGTSLDKHQKHLEHIETLIDRQTLSFLFSGAQETATQALLETAQLQATLTSIGERKMAMARQIIEIWCRFTTETPSPDAGIKLRQGVFDKPLGPPEMALVRNLHTDGLLSRKTALWLINKAGLLPPEVSPEDEAKRLDAEEPEPAVLPSVSAFGNGSDLDPDSAPGYGKASPRRSAAAAKPRTDDNVNKG